MWEFYGVSKHSLGVLIRYVLDHEGSPAIFSNVSRWDAKLRNFTTGVVACLDADLLHWSRDHNVVTLFAMLSRWGWLLFDLFASGSVFRFLWMGLSRSEEVQRNRIISPRWGSMSKVIIKNGQWSGAAAFRSVDESFPLRLAFDFALLDKVQTIEF